MTGAVPDIPGISPELVVHLFVAATGPDAADGYGWLRGIWANCHRLAGLDESLPTDGLGVAVALDPPSARPLADEAEVPLAGRQRGSAEVAQAVLRRRRDAFCLSAVLTPAVDTDDSWAAFDAMWDMVVGDDPPPALLGEARIYQGCLREPAAGDAGPGQRRCRRARDVGSVGARAAHRQWPRRLGPGRRGPAADPQDRRHRARRV
jgi:hypothetical protein